MQKTNNIPTNAKIYLIKEELHKMFSDGVLNASGKLPSTSRLAEKLGVSYVTAHRALNEMVKDGLLERRNGVGTFNKNPKFMKCDRIAIPIRVESNPFIVSCYEEISRVANKLGIQIVLGSGADEISFIEYLKNEGINFMLRFPGNPYQEPVIHKALRKASIRAVVLNDWWLDGGDFICVKNDETAAATVLLDHLFQNGHHKIMLLQDPIFESRINVVKAFQQWHFRHQLPITPENYLYTSYESEELAELIRKEGFTAILSTFDINALNIMPRLEACGIKFFEDMSIVSMEGSPVALNKNLTATALNVKELVSKAFKALLRSTHAKHKVIKVNFDFINGKSVRKIN